MSFASASSDVRGALVDGAFWVVAGMEARGASRAEIAARLEQVFGSMGGLSYQGAYAIIDRYDEGARVGGLLNRRTSDRALNDSDHVGFPGLPSNYQYWSVQTFIDPYSGKTFSRLFVTNSDTPLGQESIRADVAQQTQSYLDDQEYIKAKHGGTEWFQSGGARITGAFTQI